MGYLNVFDENLKLEKGYELFYILVCKKTSLSITFLR